MIDKDEFNKLLQVEYNRFDIELEIFEQAAAQRLHLVRSQDLAAGEKRLEGLSSPQVQTGLNPTDFAVAVGSVVVPGLIQSIPNWYVQLPFHIAIAGGIGVYFFKYYLPRFKNNRERVATVRAEIQRIRDAYSAHSERGIRIQDHLHGFVKERTLLRSLVQRRMSGEAILNWEEQRKHFDKIADFSRKMEAEEKIYQAEGGEAVLKLLGDSMSNRHTLIEGTYIALHCCSKSHPEAAEKGVPLWASRRAWAKRMDQLITCVWELREVVVVDGRLLDYLLPDEQSKKEGERQRGLRGALAALALHDEYADYDLKVNSKGGPYSLAPSCISVKLAPEFEVSIRNAAGDEAIHTVAVLDEESLTGLKKRLAEFEKNEEAASRKPADKARMEQLTAHAGKGKKLMEDAISVAKLENAAAKQGEALDQFKVFPKKPEGFRFTRGVLVEFGEALDVSIYNSAGTVEATKRAKLDAATLQDWQKELAGFVRDGKSLRHSIEAQELKQTILFLIGLKKLESLFQIEETDVIEHPRLDDMV